MKITFKTTEQLAESIDSFVFEKPANFNYIAGQYIELILPHDPADDRGIKRWFTLSSSPTEDELRITTKIIPDRSSFKHALTDLKPGDEVEIAAPEGDFTLPDDPTTELVFVAGGIGITPYHSMIQWLSDTNEKRQITLIYGLRDESEAVFTDLMESYGVNLIKLVGQPLSSQTILQNIPEPNNKLICISGPEPMVEALYEDMQKSGVNKDNLKGDYFPNYSEI